MLLWPLGTKCFTVGYTYCPVTWTEQGVSWYSSEHEGHQMNVKDRVYPYIILF